MTPKRRAAINLSWVFIIIIIIIIIIKIFGRVTFFLHRIHLNGNE